jgi:hypothetical protein
MAAFRETSGRNESNPLLSGLRDMRRRTFVILPLMALVFVNPLVFKEALIRKMELLRAKLAGSNPTLIERLLVERVVACWLQVHDADLRYAQAKELSAKWGEYYQRRMNHSHKRYPSALKTLALVRKLAVPVLQVNIANKQVNMAGPVVGKEGAETA